MDYAAVAGAGGHAQLGILLDQEDVLRARRDGVGYGGSDDAAADDQDVGLIHGNEGEDLTTESAKSTGKRRDLGWNGGFVEMGGTIDEPGLGAVVDGVVGAAILYVGVAPEGGGAVYAVFVQSVEEDVEGGQLLFVVVIVAGYAGQSFQAGVGGRHAFAHHFHNGVAAANFDVFFAFAGGTGCADFVVYVAACAD